MFSHGGFFKEIKTTFARSKWNIIFCKLSYKYLNTIPSKHGMVRLQNLMCSNSTAVNNPTYWSNLHSNSRIQVLNIPNTSMKQKLKTAIIKHQIYQITTNWQCFCFIWTVTLTCGSVKAKFYEILPPPLSILIGGLSSFCNCLFFYHQVNVNLFWRAIEHSKKKKRQNTNSLKTLFQILRDFK